MQIPSINKEQIGHILEAMTHNQVLTIYEKQNIHSFIHSFICLFLYIFIRYLKPSESDQSYLLEMMQHVKKKEIH